MLGDPTVTVLMGDKIVEVEVTVLTVAKGDLQGHIPGAGDSACFRSEA